MITSPNITVKRVVNNKPMAPTVQKIVPRPSNLIRATNAAGKVVLIQKQPSTMAPVKLLNNAKTATATSTTTSYHLVKNESGVVMQPKGQTQTMIRRVVPASATSTTATTSLGLNKPKPVARPTTHVVIHTKMGPSGATTTKTLTVAEAHQMGLLNNNKTKQMMAVAKPRPIGISAAKSPVKILPSASTNSTIVRLKQSPGAPAAAGQVQRVSTVAKAATQSHKVFLPHSAIQAGQQSGQIQAINIPGKGIQYVRFLNQSASSSSATTTSSGQKMVQVQMNKTGGAAAPGSKIIVQNNKTYVVSNGNVAAVRTASGQPVNRVMAHGAQTVVRKVISAGSSQVR